MESKISGFTGFCRELMSKTKAFSRECHPYEGYKKLIRNVLKLLPEGIKGHFLIIQLIIKRKW